MNLEVKKVITSEYFYPSIHGQEYMRTTQDDGSEGWYRHDGLGRWQYIPPSDHLWDILQESYTQSRRERATGNDK